MIEMKWNVVTWKNGKIVNHYFKTSKKVGYYHIAEYFSRMYNGREGVVLEIISVE